MGREPPTEGPVSDSWWVRHPRWGAVVAVLLGALGVGAVLALLDYFTRPKCLKCGKRMVRS